MTNKIQSETLLILSETDLLLMVTKLKGFYDTNERILCWNKFEKEKVADKLLLQAE